MFSDLTMSFFKNSVGPKESNIPEFNTQIQRERQLISKQVNESLEGTFRLNK